MFIKTTFIQTALLKTADPLTAVAMISPLRRALGLAPKKNGHAKRTTFPGLKRRTSFGDNARHET
jgi:hypothetical protein